MSFYRDVARGLAPNQSVVTKFGYNKDLDTGAAGETIRPQGGSYVPPTGAETLSVVSTSIADDFGSTGCQYLRIVGLNADYEEITEDVFMDGTTPVLTTNSFIAVNRCVGILFGTGQNNAGTITVTQSTSAIVLGYIVIGVCITQQCIYTVPVNKEAQLNKLQLEALKISGGSSPRVRFLYKTYVPESNGIYISIDQTIDTSVVNNYILDIPYASETAHKTTIWIDAITTSNDTEVTGRFYLNQYPRNIQ